MTLRTQDYINLIMRLLACSILTLLVGCVIDADYPVKTIKQSGGSYAGDKNTWISHWDVSFQNTHGLDLSGSNWAVSGQIDSSGNVYTSTIAQGPLVELNVGNDHVISKLTNKGKLSWIRQLTPALDASILTNSGNQTPAPNGTSIDEFDNFYAAGVTTTAMFEANGANDAYVVKFSSDGDFLWGRQIGTQTIADYNTANATAFSANGIETVQELITVGQYTYIFGTTNRGLGGVNADNANDIYIAKLDNMTGELVSLWQNEQSGSQVFQRASFNGTDFILYAFTEVDLGDGLEGAADSVLYRVSEDFSSFEFQHLGTAFAAANSLDLSITESHGHIVTDGTSTYISYRATNKIGSENIQGMDLVLFKFTGIDTLVWARQYGAMLMPNGTGNEFLNALALTQDNTITIGFRTTSSLFDAYVGASDLAFINIDPSNGFINWGTQFGQYSRTPVKGAFLTDDEWLYDLRYRDGYIYVFASSESAKFVGDLVGTETSVIVKLRANNGRY